MQELNNILSVIDAHFGGSQWFVLLLIGTGLFFTIYLRFPQVRFSGMLFMFYPADMIKRSIWVILPISRR